MKKHWIVLGIVLLLIGSLVLDKCGIGMCGGSWGGVVEGFSRYDDIANQKNEDGTDKYPNCDVCNSQYTGEKTGYNIDDDENTACGMPDPTKSGPYKCEHGKFAAADWIAGYNVDSENQMLPRCTVCKEGTAGDVLGNDTGREQCSMPDNTIYGDGTKEGATYQCEDGRFVFDTPIVPYGTDGVDKTTYMSGSETNNEFNKMWAADDTVVERGTWMANGDGVEGATEDQGATFLSGGDTKIASTTAAQVVPLKFCSRCGHRLHGNKNFCSECGASTMSVQ
jgi:hypothetical protein